MCFRRKQTDASGRNFLVVGLGNIGAEYVSTRHNMGFMVLDAFAKASDTFFEPGRYGEVCTVPFKGRKLTLLKPSTYVNLSGNAVRYWLGKLNLPVSQLVVICDDLNLPFGTLRLRTRGSDGGHNGLKHIQQTLQSADYTRIRIGIGHRFSPGEQIDFVLGTLSEEETAQVPQICDRVIEGVKTYCTAGAEMAMNLLNVKK
ncbi:MAG: aminoacyl-tRNA hydrolase [Bacteroidales bacterium]|nr:aminoacyl-tRNA hydrolase [Bacteroidales bacterium]